MPLFSKQTDKYTNPSQTPPRKKLGSERWRALWPAEMLGVVVVVVRVDIYMTEESENKKWKKLFPSRAGSGAACAVMAKIKAWDLPGKKMELLKQLDDLKVELS